MDTQKLLQTIDSLSKQLVELRSQLESEETAPTTEAQHKAAAGICLGCENKYPGEKFVQGLCVACNRRTKRRIEQGIVTARELIEAGLMLPKSKSGRKMQTETKIDQFIAAQDELLTHANTGATKKRAKSQAKNKGNRGT